MQDRRKKGTNDARVRTYEEKMTYGIRAYENKGIETLVKILTVGSRQLRLF